MALRYKLITALISALGCFIGVTAPKSAELSSNLNSDGFGHILKFHGNQTTPKNLEDRMNAEVAKLNQEGKLTEIISSEKSVCTKTKSHEKNCSITYYRDIIMEYSNARPHRTVWWVAINLNKNPRLIGVKSKSYFLQ